jgi:hypothetical protein
MTHPFCFLQSITTGYPGVVANEGVSLTEMPDQAHPALGKTALANPT